MKDIEDSINNQVDQILETEMGRETILEIVLEILNIEAEEQQENPRVRIDLETTLQKMKVKDQMILQEMIEMILDQNLANIVNIMIIMGILRNTVRRCKPM